MSNKSDYITALMTIIIHTMYYSLIGQLESNVSQTVKRPVKHCTLYMCICSCDFSLYKTNPSEQIRTLILRVPMKLHVYYAHHVCIHVQCTCVCFMNRMFRACANCPFASSE